MNLLAASLLVKGDDVQVVQPIFWISFAFDYDLLGLFSILVSR
jgi:hypothetical protein